MWVSLKAFDPRLAVVASVLLVACPRQPSSDRSAAGPLAIVVGEDVACIRQQEGCILCVTRRPPFEVEDRPRRICNPARTTECVEFCTTLAAECATPWRHTGGCVAETEDDFRRREFWLEAGDRPEATLVGRTLDLEGQRLSGAKVELADGSTVIAEATSGRDGGFRVPLRSGTFTIRISHPGHATLIEPLRLGAETSAAPKLFRLGAEERITGRVVGPAGEPVARAEVVATRAPGGAGAGPQEMPSARAAGMLLAAAETQSGPDGGFVLRGLEPHRYSLRAVAFGYRAEEPSRAQAPAQRMLIHLARSYVVRGQVLGPSGTPQPQARVFVLGGGASPSSAVDVWTTDAAGGYALDGFSPGTYLMWAQLGDHVTYPPMRVTIEAEDPEPLELDLKLDHEGALVSGRVVDADGRPVLGVHVELTPHWPLALPIPLGEDTGAGGKFAVDGLSPGRYAIAVRIGGRELPLLSGPRDVQVPIEGGEELELDEPLRVRRD
jgi:protocatechuate 3,4-dioxygenase beta subunit